MLPLYSISLVLGFSERFRPTSIRACAFDLLDNAVAFEHLRSRLGAADGERKRAEAQGADGILVALGVDALSDLGHG